MNLNHSVNCYFCGELFDEREGQRADEFNGGDGGDICPKCLPRQQLHKEYVELQLRQLTDDVSIDPIAWRNDDERLALMGAALDADTQKLWYTEAEALAKESGYASGRPYPYEK